MLGNTQKEFLVHKHISRSKRAQDLVFGQSGGVLEDNKKYEIRITKYKFVLVLFMMLTFFVSFFGKESYAATPAGTLGVCNIEPPEYNANGSKYHYVYFGNVPTSEDDKNMYNSPNASTNYVITAGKGKYVSEGETYPAPIRFRVLDTKSNDGDTPALFMLTEYAIGQRRWDTGNNSDSHSTQDWYQSEMRAWLNGTSSGNVLGDCFSEEEQAAIASTTTNESSATKWYTSSYEAKQINSAATDIYNNLNSDKIFLLSAKEVLNTTYGFQSDYNNSTQDINKKCYLASNPDTYYKSNVGTAGSTSNANDGAWWWLRSAYSSSDYGVAIVNNTGDCYEAHSDYTTGAVRFGLNIPLSSVIYTSDASRDLSNLSGFTSMDSIVPANPEYKLTILDSTRSNFSLTKNSVSVLKGESIVVSYENAQCTSNKEYMSAIIKDATTDDALYYGCFGRCEVASGKLVMPLPENIPAGAYKLVVINERMNGAYQTNYAGCVEITLNVTEIYPLACNIENPKWNDDLSTYDYVFFGHVTNGDEYSNDDTKEGAEKAAYVADTVTAGYSWQDANDDNKTKAPIQFRVLHTTSNGYDANSGNTNKVPALFMLTEYAIGQRRWDSSGQDWATSEMRAWLNGNNKCNNATEPYDNNVLTACFDDKEKLAIMPTSTNENGEALYWAEGANKYFAGKYTDEEYIIKPSKSNRLGNDRIFLLSAEEVVNEEYGFINNISENITGDWKRIYGEDGSRVCYLASKTGYSSNNNGNSSTYTAGEKGSRWWLRSAFSRNTVGLSDVNEHGASDGTYYSNPNDAVRFALNVPLSKIMYTSDVRDIASTPSGFKPITSSNGYRLTLLDNTRDTFKASFSQNIISKLPGESVTINYSNATTGNDEFITVLIKDAKTGEAKCYSRYPVSSVNDSINVILPDETMLGFGTYKLLVMNEKVGRAGYTNYASSASELLLRVSDDESPVVTNVYTNAGNTMFRLTAKDNYKLDKITTMENNITHEYGLSSEFVTGTSITKNFNSPYEMDSFKLYDTKGNGTEVLPSSIITDDVGPRVESITYENGNYTIRVSDLQSGIWKITNSTGDVIYQRYDGITGS